MEPVERTNFGLVFVLWAAGLGAAGQFAKISVIFPAIQQIYAESSVNLGFLVSLISFLGIVFGLLAGVIVARIGFRRLLLAALVLGAALSLYQSSLPPLYMMLASRILEGVSHLIIVVAAPTLIIQVSAQRHRSSVMTLWSTFFGVSFALVAWFGLPFVAANGVGGLFLFHSAYMGLVGAILFFMLPAQRSIPDNIPKFSLGAMLALHLKIYRSPREMAPAIGWLFYTMTFVSLLTILPGQLAQEHRAFVSSAMPLASLAVSMTLGVILLRFIAAVQLIMFGFAAAIVVVILFLIYPSNPWLFIALLGVLGLVQGASFASIPQLNHEVESQAHANGAMAQMGNLGNTLGTPILLAIIGSFGFQGMIWFLLTCYSGGLLAHVLQGVRRRRSGPRVCEN